MVGSGGDRGDAAVVRVSSPNYSLEAHLMMK